MTLKERIIAFSELGLKLNSWLELVDQDINNPLDPVIEQAFYKNGWFDKPQVVSSLKEINEWLNVRKLEKWVSDYDFGMQDEKVVGVIMAGNIPLVGYHDYLSVIISGHHLLAKVSSKDEVLLQFLHEELLKIEPRFKESVELTTDRFSKIDAVIATGSNNSSRYFDYYFSKIPHIIRKNRTSVAILSGDETEEELTKLGADIFSYYGLGCRNVTKVYFPKGFDVSWFYQGIVSYFDVINNHKYRNNYDYHKSIFLLNQEKLWDNNFLLLKQEKAMSSPVGTLYYEEYEDINILKSQLELVSDQIQCKVGAGYLNFGEAQKPELTDYSDNIDVLKFLLGL